MSEAATLTRPACACGAAVCVKHNRSWFCRLDKPRPAARAIVARWPFRLHGGSWTWCPVVDGVPWDYGLSMGHYDSLELAYADAAAWTRGEYGEVRS